MANSMNQKTLKSWDKVLAENKQVFFKKNDEYGSSWVVLGPTAITDQTYIKVKRIRTIRKNGKQEVKGDDNSIKNEFKSIINYCLMGLMKLDLEKKNDERAEIPTDELTVMFDKKVKAVRDLMIKKNTDYGEAWRDLRISSMTDLIFQNLTRLKHIEDTGTSGESEGPESKYTDCINYAVFCLILMEEGADPMK